MMLAAKNGYYGSLVPMIRDAFLTEELVRIDSKGLERSDYKKIGCKLRDLVPCILVTFEKEQIVVWRGKNYAPIEQSESFDYQVDVSENNSSSKNSSQYISSDSDDEMLDSDSKLLRRSR
ncbi:hypothetical protein GIB67_026159 [Kingdonia uniflora]|uniref:CRM domain-containing protein n=1 Tax=Kingdonia uniflora TaxID=39325 RepID=A0A7J7M342_9MAGN|nr:hypothetical protein GIB67_026159 [Kingdonia uniflora]